MSNRHILIIEDDAGIQAVTKFSLEMEGNWQVSTAFYGQEGLIKAKSLRPDVILLDIVMPDINGLKLLKSFQAEELTNNIPIILFTARVIDRDLLELNNNQVKGIITKPFDCLTLSAKILEILGWQYGFIFYCTYETLAHLAYLQCAASQCYF